MLAASGRAESDFGSSKSQRSVSTPHICNCDSNSEDEKRETPITRRETPAISDALLAMRARVGPIFPPTPKMTMSSSRDRKSTRLNSSHRCISYAVFCLKKKKIKKKNKKNNKTNIKKPQRSLTNDSHDGR